MEHQDGKYRMDKRVEAAANAISKSSGMRYDGFWSRVEDLEPEDRDYALAEAKAALDAADAVTFTPENIARIVRSTGLSIQSVNEVIRELKASAGQS